MSYFNYNYPITAYGGEFFPWGYVVQNFSERLSAGPFKGPYTIIFSPSAIDTTYFGVTKIIYDFDDGSENLIIEKDIIPNIIGSFQWDGNPISLNISHDYYPANDTTTTYNPTISVINGNLVQNIYGISFSFVPASLYDYESLRLINAIQLNEDKKESLNIFELSNPNYITNVKIISTVDTTYTKPYDTEPNDIAGLVLWLDVSDALTIDKNTENYVSYWRDKSDNSNHFAQVSANNRPLLVYAKDSLANRKALRFTASSDYEDSNAKYLQCINNTAFQTITGGYTAFIVLAPGALSGSIIAQNALSGNNQLTRNVEVKFNPRNGLLIGQGESRSLATIESVSTNFSAYNVFTVRVKDDNTGVVTADNLIFNIVPSLNTPFYFFNSDAPINIGTQQGLEKLPVSAGDYASNVTYYEGTYIFDTVYTLSYYYVLQTFTADILGDIYSDINAGYLRQYVPTTPIINPRALIKTEISEIFIYNRVITAEEFKKLENYTQAKWNIAYQTI